MTLRGRTHAQRAAQLKNPNVFIFSWQDGGGGVCQSGGQVGVGGGW